MRDGTPMQRLRDRRKASVPAERLAALDRRALEKLAEDLERQAQAQPRDPPTDP